MLIFQRFTCRHCMWGIERFLTSVTLECLSAEKSLNTMILNVFAYLKKFLISPKQLYDAVLSLYGFCMHFCYSLCFPSLKWQLFTLSNYPITLRQRSRSRMFSEPVTQSPPCQSYSGQLVEIL